MSACVLCRSIIFLKFCEHKGSPSSICLNDLMPLTGACSHLCVPYRSSNTGYLITKKLLHQNMSLSLWTIINTWNNKSLTNRTTHTHAHTHTHTRTRNTCTNTINIVFDTNSNKRFQTHPGNAEVVSPCQATTIVSRHFITARAM